MVGDQNAFLFFYSASAEELQHLMEILLGMKKWPTKKQYLPRS